MGRVAAIGEAVRVQSLGLAGVIPLPAEDPEAVRSRWQHLAKDVEVVILTPMAARTLSPGDSGPLTVVMPE